MSTTRRRWLSLTVGVAFGYLLIGANPLKAQGDCKAVLDATTKVYDTPTHAYVTMNLGGKPQSGESIFTGGMVYAKYDGKWSAGSTTREIKEITEKNWQKNKTVCRYLKDEPVNGEMAAVYSVHEVAPNSTSDSTIWISKAKGLPLRSDEDLGGGKTHLSTRYEYGNVKPPI
ncbi:MAG: hypothetical protein ABSD20_09590 [Terriglobales bacterium]